MLRYSCLSLHYSQYYAMLLQMQNGTKAQSPAFRSITFFTDDPGPSGNAEALNKGCNRNARFECVLNLPISTSNLALRYRNDRREGPAAAAKPAFGSLYCRIWTFLRPALFLSGFSQFRLSCSASAAMTMTQPLSRWC